MTPTLSRVFAITSILFLFIFGSCSKDISPSVEEEIQSANANIKPDKLYGKWKVSILEADNPVDLNNDGSASTNIIQETNCFNTMGVVFDEDRNFTTTNAQMDFTAGT